MITYKNLSDWLKLTVIVVWALAIVYSVGFMIGFLGAI